MANRDHLPSVFTGTGSCTGHRDREPRRRAVHDPQSVTNGPVPGQGKRSSSARASVHLLRVLPGFGPRRIRHFGLAADQLRLRAGITVDSAICVRARSTRRNFTARSDPQQTISLGCRRTSRPSSSQRWRHRPSGGAQDRLLSINTSSLSTTSSKRSSRSHRWQDGVDQQLVRFDLLPGFRLSVAHDC